MVARSNAYPANGVIQLMSTGGLLAETWVKGDHAEVETKWTDDNGRIDSALRYRPPEIDVTMTVYKFDLVFTNKHTDMGADCKTTKTVIGPWEWKLDYPQTDRVATVDRAIDYVAAMRDKSNDPVIKRNADRTIAALNRLSKRRCGSASAC